MAKRMLAVFLVIVAAFSALACRMASLSTGEVVAANAHVYGSRTISVDINSARGVIYDRNLEVLAGGYYRPAVLVEPMTLDEQSRELLYQYVERMSAETLRSNISAGRPFLAYTTETLSGAGLTSIRAIDRTGAIAQNLIGYINADGHGVAGVEAAFDEHLFSAESGYTAVFSVDATRRALSGLGITYEGNAQPQTKGVILGLDRKIQQLCEEIADEMVARGAVLVCDLETGDIVASVSRPTYDANSLTDYLDGGDAMLNKPFNRFSCGSAFKIIVTAAALENGIDFEFSYTCTGEYSAGENILACGKKEGHGKLNMKEAFADSCNTYFCELAATVGADKVLGMAQQFGLGESTDFGGGMVSAAGTLPLLRDLSAPAALANFSIGQGALQVTPVQVLNMAAIIANDGVWRPLTLVKYTVDHNGNQRPVVKGGGDRVILEKDIAVQIKEMMLLSTVGGTGATARPELYSAGVKTSSAETGIYEDGKQVLHTWVTGFYPIVKPKYAICVLVEGGRSGYYSAAPVFAKIANALMRNGFVNES